MAYVCNEDGCPTISDKTRCAAHRRQAERERGSRHERGYGSDHVAVRQRWAPLVATGNVKCWSCGEYIAAGQAWDLGHDKRDRTTYRGPECWPCNRDTTTERTGISPDA